MNSFKTGPIMVGFVLGVALGVAGTWRYIRSEAAAPEATEVHAGESHADEHGHTEGGKPDEHAGHAHAGCANGHGHAAEADGHEHESHEEGNCIVLSDKAILDSGIVVSAAGSGELEQTLDLPGEIMLNADNVAHIVPRVSGIVRRVDKNLGDEVQAGEVMAILESRELAESKAALLAAQQRLALAQANIKSAQELHQRKIMPDLEFLTIEKARAEAEIELQAAGNKLHALGVAPSQVLSQTDADASLALYELRAPFTGTVVQKHCALGEVLTGESDAFVLADLSTVWATISVYPHDVHRVRPGQTVHIRADGLDTKATGEIVYMAPIANEATRTVYARADLANPDRQWRPGAFITASIVLDRVAVPVLVPVESLQRVKTETVVFITDEDGFEPRPVTVGRTNSTTAEILDGLAAGEHYVSKGAVVLKAELGKRGAVHQH